MIIDNEQLERFLSQTWRLPASKIAKLQRFQANLEAKKKHLIQQKEKQSQQKLQSEVLSYSALCPAAPS